MALRRVLALAFCLLASLSCGSVAQTISSLPAAGTPTGAELVAVVQGTVTVKMTTAQIASLGGSGGGGTPGNPTATIGATAINGVATTYMRSDAAPALPATLPGLNGSLLTNLTPANLASQIPVSKGGTNCTVGGVGCLTNVGALSGTASATTFLRGDGTWGTPIGSGNVNGPVSSVSGDIALFLGTGGTAIQDPGYGPNLTIAGTSVNLGGSISTSTILDSLGSVQGDLAYRGASGWTVLAPGTSGNVLATQGASQNPHWVAATSGGTVTSIAQGGGILLSTAPCVTTCTISTTLTTNPQTGTTYATASSDGGEVVSLVNASAIAVSIVQANTTNFTAGFGTTYFNKSTTIGGGLVTVTAATSIFGNGLTTLKVYPGQSCDIASDSTNYSFTSCSLPLLATNSILANTSGAANYPVPTTSTNITNLLSAHPLAMTDTAQAWTAQQSNTPTTLTISTATFTPDGSSNNYHLTLVHASCPCTLANPSVTPVPGTGGVIKISQSSTGADTIGTYGSSYIAQGGTSTLALSTGANAIDVLSYYVIDTTHILLTPGALNATH